MPLALGCLVGFPAVAQPPTRQERSLDGPWLFRRDDAPSNQWKTVQIPSTFESHEGTNFNGVGWYRKAIASFKVPPDGRLLLHFQAAATEAEVWWDGKRLGSHLGGWTPFRFDVTDNLRQAPAGRAHEITVRLDEKVGHNTQGFLPIIAPHFGGIWQGVKLLQVPAGPIDDLGLLARGDPDTGRMELEVPIQAAKPGTLPDLEVRYRRWGENRWQTVEAGQLQLALAEPPAGATVASVGPGRRVIRAGFPVKGFAVWEPSRPRLYDVEIRLRTGNSVDTVTTRAAFRKIEAAGTQLRLNGRPLGVRGLLNWGYAPPRTAPSVDEAWFRRELEFARSHGFNLMKFCLWMPPKRYLELADEIGMLTWMEYPTWHPDMTARHLPALRREFAEFFAHDRNHPSIILRSLTCETGSGAELGVIQSLYDLAKAMVPGSVVEDDSSWIGWNRVHDFYDDHPYGNNHTWVKTLQGLNDHIQARRPKPLVLGEAIAADTWVDTRAVQAKLGAGRPFWSPGVLDKQADWLDRMRRAAGPEGLAELRPDSLHYGLLMRKYQIETYRREVPQGGYVVSVIRDIPNASMGLIDYLDHPKWSAAEWAWQRDTMLLLKTETDRRSFAGGENLQADLLVSHFGAEPIAGASFSAVVRRPSAGGKPLGRFSTRSWNQDRGTLVEVARLSVPLPAVSKPERILLQAELRRGGEVHRNEWPLWLVPGSAPGQSRIAVHPSVNPQLAAELFPFSKEWTSTNADAVVVASRFDDDLVKFLERGGGVLMLPDGLRGSLPVSSHWFLRGAPWIAGHPLNRLIPRELFVELQHFDLAAGIVPNPPYLEDIDPLLMLWDTHDLRTIKTHGLVFETGVGEGRLLVSALRHDGANAAGRWLLRALLDHLAAGPPPRHALSAELWQALKEKLHEEKIALTDREWRLRPDPRNEGFAAQWFKADLVEDDTWKPVRVGAHWESQGFPSLDGWAWYRIRVPVPASWKGRTIYLSFEGVDDLYELFVNGRLVAKRGDLATRQDTFNERFSHDLTSFVEAGVDAVIAVRVHDWYGAGGIFRPVTLSTAPLREGGEVIR